MWTDLWSLVLFGRVADTTYGFWIRSKSQAAYISLIVTPMAVSFVTLPLSGWLADSRFGNFKVFGAGCVLMFLGSVLLCVHMLLILNLNWPVFYTSIVLGPISHLFSFSGSSACFVTVFQLGLDQMPDASSAGITSYILAFLAMLGLGCWLSDSLITMMINCTQYHLSIQGLSLLLVICMCVALSSLLIFGKKWLIIEPKSPQSLKNIYRVLKFAAKHKAPLNRSALTYWEEDIPSRLDLGKSRFGGPFTTEQVEDVKTFFKMLLLFLPVWIVLVSTSIFGTLGLTTFTFLEQHNQSAQICIDSIYRTFTYSPWWCCSVTMFVYTALLYLCLKNRLPSSILKRLGFWLCLLVLCNSVYTFISYYFNWSVWPGVVHTCVSSSLLSLVNATTTEFVCAQSPYSMRGFLSGLNFLTITLSVTVGLAIYNNFIEPCHSKHCLIIPYSIGGGLSIAGFLLYLVVAGRYKRRVRDEEYNPQTHIEAIYDRYLTQALSSH